MKVLGISGSPRVGGNTDLIVQESLNAASEEGAVVRLLRICDCNLKPCDACRVCFGSGECAIKDDIEKLYQAVMDADGLILASPVYFQGVTAQMKTFIDRVGYLHNARGRKDFEGKVAGVIAVARRSGLEAASSQMLMFLTASRMVIPSGGRVFAVAREKGEVMSDDEGVDSARYLGKMMAKTIQVSENLRRKV